MEIARQSLIQYSSETKKLISGPRREAIRGSFQSRFENKAFLKENFPQGTLSVAPVNTQVSPLPCKLPVIQIRIGKVCVGALIDSGASISIFQNSTVVNLEKDKITEMNMPNLCVKSLSGQSLEMNSYYQIPISLGTKTYDHKFFISTNDFNAPYQAILGYDFLKT